VVASPAMGVVFLVLIVAAVIVGLATGRIGEVSTASVDAAGDAVILAIGLIGVMTFWLGVVEVLRRAGLMGSIARALRPVFRRLFPEIPDGHPALAAITMNIAANMLGLTNAATPFGLDAMSKLDRLNGRRGTATDSMCLFLAINTSAVAVLPTGVIAARAALGSQDSAGILVPTLIATSLSTVAAITAAFLLSRLPVFRRSRPAIVVAEAGEDEAGESAGLLAAEDPQTPPWRPGRLALGLATIGVTVVLIAMAVASGAQERGVGEAVRSVLTAAPLPLIILVALGYGWARGVPVYAALVDGAKEGFQVAVRIIPFLVAVLVAVGMFRASGALDAIVNVVGAWTALVGLPGEALPMALLRPLSGSGAYAVMSEIMQNQGPDSFVGYLVSTMQGSTETTFYVMAVYGGQVGLSRTRHAVPACLFADAVGIVGATFACHLFFN
jgi:spore maturation protein SpmA